MLNPIVNNPFGNGFLQNNHSLPRGLGVNFTQNQISKVGAVSTPNILKDLGVDTTPIEQKVDQDIQNVKTYSQEDFKQRVEQMSKGEGIPLLEAYQHGLKYIQSQNGVIDGIDIDKELAELQQNQPDQTNSYQEPPQKEKQPEGGSFVRGVVKGTGGILPAIGEGVKDFGAGLTAAIPKAIGNTLGFINNLTSPIGKAQDYLLSKLTGKDIHTQEEANKKIGAFFKQEGERQAKDVYKMTGADEESIMSGIGEFGGDILLLATPAGKEKLITKLPEAGAKIRKLYNIISKFSPEKTQKLKGLVTTLGKGGLEGAKFGIIDKGDINATDVVVGGAGNLAGKVLGAGAVKLRGDFGNNMYKLFKPTISKDNNTILKDISLIGQDFKNQSIKKGKIIKPKNLEDFYSKVKNRLKTIFTKDINPRLKKAGDKVGTLNLSDILNKVEAEASKGPAGTTLDLGDAKYYSQLKTLLSSKEEVSLQELNEVKQYISNVNFANKQYGLGNPLDDTILPKLNKTIQSKIDDVLDSVGEGGIKDLKRLYAAYSNNLSSINKRLIQENKEAGVGLLEGIGKIRGLENILRGDVTTGVSNIVLGDIFKKLKDPNNLLDKAFKSLYSTHPVQGAVKHSGTILGVKGGEQLDKKFSK